MSRLLASLILILAVAASGAAQEKAATIEVTGAAYTEFDEASGIWQMRGNPVTVSRGTLTVRAPAITYDSKRQIVRATGGAVYTDEKATLSANEITLWVQEDRAVAEGQVTAVLVEGRQETRLRSSRVEFWSKEKRALATGNAVVTSPEGTLAADRLEVYSDREEVIAEGHAVFLHEDIEGRAPKAVLQRREKIAVLSGGATVRQGRNEISAATVTVDLQQKRVTASGEAHVVVYSNR